MGTISQRRGSVRGAPPDVYVGFGSFHKNEEEEDKSMEPVAQLFGNMIAAAVAYLVIFFLVVASWVIWRE